MIEKYSDDAANERTFLAWIRISIAVIAFGFVIEKLNLFMIVLAKTVSEEAAHRLWIDRVTRPFGRYDGIALVLVGAAIRFYRTAKLIDDPETRQAPDARIELVFTLILALLATGLCLYLVLS